MRCTQAFFPRVPYIAVPVLLTLLGGWVPILFSAALSRNSGARRSQHYPICACHQHGGSFSLFSAFIIHLFDLLLLCIVILPFLRCLTSFRDLSGTNIISPYPNFIALNTS